MLFAVRAHSTVEEHVGRVAVVVAPECVLETHWPHTRVIADVPLGSLLVGAVCAALAARGSALAHEGIVVTWARTKQTKYTKQVRHRRVVVDISKLIQRPGEERLPTMLS